MVPIFIRSFFLKIREALIFAKFFVCNDFIIISPYRIASKVVASKLTRKNIDDMSEPKKIITNMPFYILHNF